MCGIFGLIGSESVSKRLIAGAGRLQNRGHRSTKVVTFDGKIFHSHGGLQPATILFADFDPRRLKGTSGIVHTRYVTAGKTTEEDLKRNIQPVFTERPGMATCNNGDLINVYSQTQKLKEKGFSFQTEVDAKVIQNTLIDSMMNLKTYRAESDEQFVELLWQAVEETQKQLVGAYSVLCLLENGLLAFRDPNGIRPLSMATRLDEEGNICEAGFASESSVFNYFGDYHNVNEVRPGEAVWIGANDLRPLRRQIIPRREAFCFFEYVYFARPDSVFKNRRVEVVRGDLGRMLAEECEDLKDRIDVVCGLPGTSISSGHMFAEYLGKLFRRAIIKVDNRRSFQETSDAKRKKAIDEKFIFVRDYIDGQRIAVIDDSNVRGTTAKKIIARLRELGAKEVHMLYFSPPIIGPCFYGIDTPDETKLIAFGKTNEQIRDEMGCDSVRYISHAGLYTGIGVGADQLCTACITRQYPTDTTELISRSEGRRQEREASGGQ
ncbi:MAG TPA: amidophosphoribosyltransferase [bacterium]|nr:amidophosphoribosyltransferase [bacterium]